MAYRDWCIRHSVEEERLRGQVLFQANSSPAAFTVDS